MPKGSLYGSVSVVLVLLVLLAGCQGQGGGGGGGQEAGTARANIHIHFVVEANNQQGDVIFRGEATVNLRAGEEADLTIPLVAREVRRLVATQRVTAVAGGTVLVFL